jgi:hypothetical protein
MLHRPATVEGFLKQHRQREMDVWFETWKVRFLYGAFSLKNSNKRINKV